MTGLLLWLLLSLPATAEEADFCELQFSKVYGPDAIETAMLNKADGDLFSLPLRTPAEAASANENVFKALREETVPTSFRNRRKAELTETEVRALYKEIESNKQVSESLCGTYKGSDQAGFCFGRAMAAHLMAIQSGLNKQSIRKIWAVGRLERGDSKWRYHVGTLVRVKDKGWYVVDPIMKKPMPVEDWYATMQGFDPKGTMRIYSSPASRFGPSSIRKYNKTALAHDYYHGFFGDLIDTLHRERTGKPSPWSKAKSAAERTNYVKTALIGTGIAVPTGAAALKIYRHLTEPREQKPEESRVSP